MACDCINRLGDKIRKEYGDNAYVNTALMFDGTERFDLTGTYGNPYNEKKEDTAD